MTAPTWFPDEEASAGSEHLDAAYIAAYDAKAGVDWAAELDDLLRLGLAPDSTLVDIGTGTGGLALAAAPVVRRVVAVDVSPTMVAVTRERAARAGIVNVETVRAGFLTYGHAGEPADFVYTRHALHHLPDVWKAIALDRIGRILRPGGILRLRDLIFSCPLAEAEETIEAWLGGASTIPGVGWSRAELDVHLKTEHSTFSWLLEPMLAQAGFAIARAEFSDNRVIADYVCVKPG